MAFIFARPFCSIVLTEPPPPMPSIRRMWGSFSVRASDSEALRFSGRAASADPPRTVKSSPETTAGRPSTSPSPNTKFDGIRSIRLSSSS